MTKLSFSKRLFIGAAAGSLMLVSGTGCGNWASSGVIHSADPATYQASSSTYSSPFANGGYPGDTTDTCPAQTNITTTGGADAYTVCQSNTSGFAVSIHGSPSLNESMVYVFPVDVISATQFNPNFDANGNVLFQNADMSSGVAYLQFASARFNAAFVVSAANASDMSWCLAHGNLQACPAYSYERFGPYDSATGSTTSN